MLMPSARSACVVSLRPQVLDRPMRQRAIDDAAFTLSAVVTREGRVVNLELHPDDGQTPAAGSSEARAVQDMLGAMSQARFEPARVAGLTGRGQHGLAGHAHDRARREDAERDCRPTPAAKKRRVV